jgi:hypothetical protein
MASCCGPPKSMALKVLVTGDQSLRDGQNLFGRRLATVALSANNWPIIKNHLSQIPAAIESAAPGSFQTAQCGTFTRKKAPIV